MDVSSLFSKNDCYCLPIGHIGLHRRLGRLLSLPSWTDQPLGAIGQIEVFFPIGLIGKLGRLGAIGVSGRLGPIGAFWRLGQLELSADWADWAVRLIRHNPGSG